jgi:two-component system, OmpR family, phosphate regulon sensor histidine kinase PhoR
VLGLRARIAITAIAATAGALIAVLLIALPGLQERTTQQAGAQLDAQAHLVARLVQPLLASGADRAALDALVDAVGRDLGERVTVIAPDGRVLADSAASDAALDALDNHGDRPEVRAALRDGRGVAKRHSATVDQDLLYSAVAVRSGDRLLGVARVAQPLAGVRAQARHFGRAVLWALAIAFAITAVLSALFASSLAGPLTSIMDAARQFAAGNLEARSRVSRTDELGELARILNRSADQLRDRITEIARDRARTDAILSAMEDGVLAVDHDGVVLLANHALSASLGLRDPVGHPYVEAVRQREVGQVLQHVLKTGERSVLEAELHHLRRVYALTGVPFPGVEGQPHGAVLTFHDVTERRRLEQVRRDFVANASHELRTPLTSIRGFVEALEDGAMADPSTAERFLGKIHTHADRMGALVEDLLELSRLEAGERPPLLEPVDVAEVADDVTASFAELAERKSQSLTSRHEAAPAVRSDSDRIRRILENLVENALKYTPSGGSVTVDTRPAHGGVEVIVSDDGPGIAAEHLPRIFERFYRVDKARSRDLGGTGLGLSIVRHLAESIGASVAVASEVGKGTTFRVALPARPTIRTS